MLDDLLNSLTEGFLLLLQVAAGLLGAAIGLAVIGVFCWAGHWLVTHIPFPIGA